jgi:hypothetical protein
LYCDYKEKLKGVAALKALKELRTTDINIFNTKKKPTFAKSSHCPRIDLILVFK